MKKETFKLDFSLLTLVSKIVLINPKWTLNNHRNLWTDLRNLKKIT